MNENLIDEYMKIVTKYTDAPEVFLKASAYHTFSFLCGNYFKIPDLFKPKPNLWFLLSSIPGRFRRSTVAELNEFTLKTSIVEYARWYEENFNEQEWKRDFYKSFIEDGNTEGILDQLQEGIEQNISSFSINSTEFGGIIKKMTTSGYREGADRLLSKLYYGESYKQALSQRSGKPSRYIPSGLYVCMLAGMQEPEHYLSVKQSRQGLLRRIIIIYFKPQDAIDMDWRAPLGNKFQTQAIYSELDAFCKMKVIPLLKKYNSIVKEKGEIEVIIDSYTLNSINKLAEEIDKNILMQANDYNIYRQTYWEHLVKMSTINALAQTEPKLINGEISTLMLNKDVFDNSKDFFNKLTKHSKEMMDNLDIVKKPREVETIYEKVELKIIESGYDGITRSKLLNSIAGLTKDKLDKIIDTLLDANKIYAEPINTGGRPSTIYKSKIKAF
jgi:hypothetical protein